MEYDESIKVYRDHLVTISFAKEEGIEIRMKKRVRKVWRRAWRKKGI